MRVNHKMGMLVTLVTTCLQDVTYFCIYLGVWLIAMTISYKVLGFTATGYEQLNDGSFFNFFLQVWENSIGNINPPSFKDQHPSTLRVCTVYAMWFLTQFIVLIILLNFLIAVISQSYENVMNSSIILTYNNRCDFNKEMYQVGFNYSFNNNCVVLSVPDPEIAQESSEWVGFVQTMKIFVKNNLL